MSVEVVSRYAGDSGVKAKADGATVRLFANLCRQPTSVRARLLQPLVFRDALLALSACVRSELYVDEEELLERVLDPVVTVTESACFFEALSLDASTYGRVSLYDDAFSDRTQLVPGTTNVELTRELHLGLERIRSGTPTGLDVTAAGLEVEVAGTVHREHKVALPEAWVEGFARVQDALQADALCLDLRPSDLVDVLTFLRGRKAKTSPRSLRVELLPDAPPELVVEPWDERFELTRSTHTASEPTEVRLWGRRRLLLLQRVLPHARRVHAQLHGSGRASFWRCDLGAAEFLLGVTGWLARDWPGKPGPGSAGALFDPRSGSSVPRELVAAS